MILDDDLPSGSASPRMRDLDRVYRTARANGFRVGLQVGDHGRVVLHVRDMTDDLKVIAVIGMDIESAAVELLHKMMAAGYCERGSGI
jgi:hypothetical protein